MKIIKSIHTYPQLQINLKLKQMTLNDLIFYNNNFNNQMSWFESSTIQTTLEALMVILIIAASYALIFQETQYWYFIILIMFAFLFYVMRKKYAGAKNKTIFHELPHRKKPTFKQQYQKKQKSRAQFTGDKQNSYISYLNRTKKAGDSFSRLMSKEDEKLKDFSFIRREDNKKMMSHSFIAKSKNLNDTFFRQMESNQNRRQEREQKAEQKFKQCNRRYYQTLNKLTIKKANVQNLYGEVKNLCRSFTKQLYQQELNNLKQIIQSLEELYTVKVICRDLVDLNRKLSERKMIQENRMEIKLEELIQKLIKNKGKELSYPLRKTNQHVYKSLKEKQKFSLGAQPTLLSQNQSQKARRKLEKLITQQIKLNSYFNDENKHWVSGRQLIQKLKLISQEIQNQEYYDYLSEGRNNVPKQYSQKLLLIFNISRNKLNDIVGDKNRALLFKTKSIMGWIRNQTSVFQIKQTLNSDFGHPHYDLCVHKSVDSNFYCEYGANNGYSLIYMYLTALKNLQKQFVQDNKILLNIIPKCCWV